MINLFSSVTLVILLLTGYVKLNIATYGHHYSDHQHRSDAKDLTVDLQDPWGYEAIKSIHNKIDDDQNGSIDRKESLKFIVKDLLINEGDAEIKEETLHSNDHSISVDEMWENWSQSDVSKWSVEETVDWLIYHVKLPQYAINFIENHIDGSRLPRIAANPMFVTHILKITDPLDRQKLTLNAVEVVLFGIPRRFIPNGYLIAILIATSAVFWFVLKQRQNVQQRLDKVFRQMSNLQQSRYKLMSIQEELEKAKQGKQQALDEKENLSHLLKSQSDSISQSEMIKEKEATLIAEIAATRRRLVHVEQMLNQTPVERIEQQKSQLQRWLQITYEIENKNYRDQKTQFEADLIKHHNQTRNKRKKTIRRHQSSTLDENLKSSRLRLTELINEIEVCRDKWEAIENLCGFAIRDNPGLAALQHPRPSFSSYARMSSMLDDGEMSDYEDESFTPSPNVDGEFFPDYSLYYRPPSRTSEYSAIKRNSSAKQLARLISTDESNDGKWSVRSQRKAGHQSEKSTGHDLPTIVTNEHKVLSKSPSSTSMRRMLIRRSSSLQDILFNMPGQSLLKPLNDKTTKEI